MRKRARASNWGAILKGNSREMQEESESDVDEMKEMKETRRKER